MNLERLLRATHFEVIGFFGARRILTREAYERMPAEALRAHVCRPIDRVALIRERARMLKGKA